MKYKMFKLISGEFMICGIKKDTIMDIEINTPMIVHFQQAPNGQLGINLFPMNPFATTIEDERVIKKDHIMFEVSEINPEVLQQYIEIASGISIEKTMPPLADLSK